MSTDEEFQPTHIVTIGGFDIPICQTDDDEVQAAATVIDMFVRGDVLVKSIATGETKNVTAVDIADWWA